MPFSPKAPTFGCVLCVFVVKNPLSVHSLHGTRAVPARPSTTPCTDVIHFSRLVGHLCEAFSTRHASPISVRPYKTWIHNIFNVIKCNHLYRQLPTPNGHCGALLGL
jgi:hypothetical protein